MSIFLVSDEHYHHSRIIQYCLRSFASVEEMNEELIRRHNSVVSVDDTVYHLGDFTFKEECIKEILPRLNGVHYLISGNHDKCHSCHSKNKKAIRRYLEYGFKSIQEQAEISFGGRDFLLSHFPYLSEDNGDGGKYAQWRPIDKGKILLCGHVHSVFLTKDRMINVGVDVNNYTPVSENQILEIVKLL